MSWQIATMVSVIVLSTTVVLQRTLLFKYKCDPYALVVVFQLVVGLVTWLFALVDGFLWPDFSQLWLPALGSIILRGLGHIAYAKTLQLVEASVFSVLYATSSIWLMCIGVVLFGEHLTIMQVVGALLIFASIALLVRNCSDVALSKGVLLGLVTGVLFAAAVTCWVYVGRQADVLSWAAIGFVGASVTALAVRPTVVRTISSLWSWHKLVRLLVLGFLFSVGAVALLLAYTLGGISQVSPLRQIGIVLTVVMALAFLPQERSYIRRKIVAALICLFGVLLILM